MTTTTPSPTKLDSSTGDFKAELNSKVARLRSNSLTWATMPLTEKIAILKELESRVLNDMYAWGRSAAAVKGMDQDKWAVAEGTLITPLIVSKYITALIETFETMARDGKCPQVTTHTLPSGQTVARVWPAKESDKDIRLKDVTVDLYIKPGQPATQGGVYLGPNKSGGKVAALLGAGNLGFLGLKDILYMLFEQNNVVLFKPHPIQADWQKFADVMLEPLTKRGFYQSVYADSVQDTRDMLYHPGVEMVHMTGGTATHDSIVWGTTPEEQAKRKAENDPVLKVPITSELGCVTPWIVTPGAWTDAQLQDQAASAASVIYLNNGCACNALKVLVLPETWPQADAFISKIKAELAKLPLQPAFYPGHNQRYNAWRAQFPAADIIQTPLEPSTKDFGGAQHMPYAIQELPYPKPGQPLTEQQKYAFTVEPFAPVMTIVRIPSTSAPAYMAAATEFANKTLWGTLSCTVLVHPDMERDHLQAVNKMLDDLEYGSVVTNCYSGAAYAAPHTIWGAFGGDQTIHDIGSGVGSVNNTLLFDHPQKAVMRFPLINASNPKPTKNSGIPAIAFGPLTGLLVGGWRGLGRALLSWR